MQNNFIISLPMQLTNDNHGALLHCESEINVVEYYFQVCIPSS